MAGPLISLCYWCALWNGYSLLTDDMEPLNSSKHPKERGKLFLALTFAVTGFFLNLISLSVIHERVPDQDKQEPLSDIILDNVPEIEWALTISEVIISVLTPLGFSFILFHKHRYIILQRLFLILGMLYLMRSLTIFVTVLPVSKHKRYCAPKVESKNATLVFSRAWHLMTGFGLAMNGKHIMCGDLVYSGHTVMMVLFTLFLIEYSPKRLRILHWLLWALVFLGIGSLMISHSHYTLDIIIAYYVTTRIFWTYHTLANNSILKRPSQNNYLSREWWYYIFYFFEKNISGRLPVEFECPWPLNCIFGKH